MGKGEMEGGRQGEWGEEGVREEGSGGERERKRDVCQCTSKGDSHIPLAVSSSLPLLFSSSPLVTLTDVSPLFLNRPVNPFYSTFLLNVLDVVLFAEAHQDLLYRRVMREIGFREQMVDGVVVEPEVHTGFYERGIHRPIRRAVQLGLPPITGRITLK